MVFVFFSFQTIEIAYIDQIDLDQHIVISQKSEAVFEVIKEGRKLQAFFNKIAEIKDQQMSEESKNLLLQSPIFVCLTAKSKKISQPILQLLSPTFERHVLYVRIDKNEFKDLPVNRAVLVENQVCYGQGHSQLRQKQELRIAIISIFTQEIKNAECIFIQKNANQIKELKKEGFTNIVTDFEEEIFINAFKIASNACKELSLSESSQILKDRIIRFPFAESYLNSLLKNHKEIGLKQIIPFDLKKITIEGVLNGLFRQSTYYNISPKSWVPHKGSRQISSYIFHNVSNMQLSLARASKLRQFVNQEQFQIKILAYYIYFIINPSAYALPQDKLSSLMKFSKIKSYQNKRAMFNVRPYIQGLATLNELQLSSSDILNIFITGQYSDRQVKGLGSLLLSSLILNDNLNIKTLCEQTAFLSVSMQNDIKFLNQITLQQQKDEIYLCRTDFYNVLGLSNYKLLNENFLLTNKGGQVTISLKDLHPNILKQMKQKLIGINDQKLQMIKSLIIYYRWNTKLVTYYEVIIYRLGLIRQALKEIPFVNLYKNSFIIDEYPKLACLLLKENYNYFMIPSKNLYSPIEYSYDPNLQTQRQTQNPFLVFFSKTCSFAIYNISFPVFTFLQWIKSTNKYQIIEYISMINHTFQDYVIMDKRLKLQITNQKKNAILIVDHVQLCQALINRPKSIKTVMILRLRKINDIEDVGMISSEPQKHQNFKQSDDELIDILMREGSKQLNEQSEFYLYNWVFKTYVRIKCSLYHLDYQTALQFSQILHKAISTNCHRLKQIQQNHPNLYVYLYTLPIIKDNQKVIYNYRLLEYFHMYYLFEKILNKQWNCRLETYQNSSVTNWRHIIGTQLTIKIVRSLMEYLQSQQKQDNEQPFASEQQNDCLELIRTITQPLTKEDSLQPPFTLYYEVFGEHIIIKNYQKIKDIKQNQRFIAIQDHDTVNLSIYQSNETLSLPKQQDQNILCFYFEEKQHIYVLKNQGSSIFLQKIRVLQQISLSCQIQTNINITNVYIQELLQSSIRVYLKIINQTIYLIFEFKHKLVFQLISSSQISQPTLKQYNFNEQIVHVTIVNKKNGAYLICTTQESLYTMGINDLFDDSPQFLKKLPIKLNNKTKFLFTEVEQFDLQFLIFENTSLEITSISSRQVVNTRRIQLPKPIKALTISNHILFVFQQGNDSLFLYNIKEESCERLWRYFWVEPNCTKLFVKGNTLCMIGGSYLKKIRLRNLENLVHFG